MTAPATVVFACTACGFVAPVPAERVGRTIGCPRCAGPQEVGASPARPAPGRIAFICATCDLRARIPERYAGTTVHCPRCTTRQALPARAVDDPRLSGISQLGLPALSESDPPRPRHREQRERLEREHRARREEDTRREQAALREQAARLEAAALREQERRRERARAELASARPAEGEADAQRVVFTCAGCGYRGRLGAEFAGRRIRCPRCRTAQPVAAAPGPAPTATKPSAGGATDPIRFGCTACGRRALIAGGCAGRRVRCPGCGTVQVATDRAAAPSSGTTGWNPLLPEAEPDDHVPATAPAPDAGSATDGAATDSASDAEPTDDAAEAEAGTEEPRAGAVDDAEAAGTDPADGDDRTQPEPRAARRPARRGRPLRWVAVAAAAVVAVGSGILALRPSAPPTPPTAVVELGDLEATVAMSGRVTAQRETVVRARAAGVVARIPVEVGERVRAGQILLEIDPESEERALRQAANQLERAQAKLATTRQNTLIAETYQDADRQRAAAELTAAESRARDAHARAARLDTLHAKRLASDEDHQSAREAALQADAEVAIARSRADETRAQEMASQLKRQEVRAAEDQVAQEQAAVEEARTRLAATRVVAPCDGTLVGWGVAVGDEVDHTGGGTVLARIADLSRLWLVAAVPEADVGRLAVGQPARIGADGAAVPARVERIAPVAAGDGGAATVEVRLELAAGSALQPGRTVDARVITAARQRVPTLPNEALTVRRRSRFAAVLTPGGVEERIVATGVVGDERIEITRGLVVGERVLLPRSGP